jgi:cellulose biosynthesis protein BcsQ
VLGLDPAEIDVSPVEVLAAPRRTRTSRAASSVSGAIVPSEWGAGVDVLPASPHLHRWEQAGTRTVEHARDAVADLAAGYDAVLIDCPPSLGHLTTTALTGADLALIVVEPAALGLRGISAVADRIDDIWDTHNPALDLAGVIVNRVPAISAEAQRRIDELGRVVGRKAVWHPFVPQRVIVGQAISERRPVHAYGGRAADLITAFDALWEKLHRRLRAVA